MELKDEELRGLRKCTYAGMPYGDEAFMEAMEERFGRRWRRPGARGAGESERQIAVSA